MLQHLTGLPLPGIHSCQTFSSDLAHRTRELLLQHEAVLTFLRSNTSSISAKWRENFPIVACKFDSLGKLLQLLIVCSRSFNYN